MKKIKHLFILILLSCITEISKGQNTFRVIILDEDEKEPLTGAIVSVKGTTNGSSTGKDGKGTLTNILDGKQAIQFSVSFQTKVY